MRRKKLLVVKIGGGAGLDLDAVCDDLAIVAAERPWWSCTASATP